MNTSASGLAVGSPSSPTPQSHPAALIFIHWATLILIALAVGLVLLREEVEARELRTQLMNLHRSLGLTVAALAVARILLRWVTRPLASAAATSGLARLAATGVHLCLYGLLFALPLIGWALSNAHGHSVSFFGLVDLPNLVGADEDLGDQLEEWHEGAAGLLMGLVGVHAAAALWHHFACKDGVLRAMLPGWLAGRRG